MQRPWNAVALATALITSGPAAVAHAQTVVLRNAPPASAVEVVLNATTVGTGTADQSGVATLPVRMKETIGKTEIDAHVFVEACEGRSRIHIVEVGGALAAAEPGCSRQQVSGLYWVRPVNTIVVNLSGTAPSLLLIRGSYTPPPAGPDGVIPDVAPQERRQSPTGIVLTGGAGLSNFRDAKAIACGTAEPCSGKPTGVAFSGAAAYWLTRYLGVEGSYVKPKTMTASGGTGFTFDSSLGADVWTLAGVGAVPIGPVRLYGKGGVNYHQAVSETSQTMGGATQTFLYRTKGYGWLFGGGLEGWVSSRVAIFGEGSLARIRGDAEGGGEALIDDRLRLLVAGLRIHIGG